MLQLVLPALLLLEASRLGACSPLRAAESPQDEVMEVMDEPKYHDFDPETVEELLSQDHAVMEGDLLQLSDRNAVGVAWPTHVIPYMIDPNLAARRGDVLAALAMLSKHTCLTFPKRTDEADYLHFQTSEGCASFVGFVGGGQSLFIGPTCVMGNIVHEILHAVGFHHEHTRTDRGPYIKVLTENILPGKERNFEQIAGTTFDLSYDISSILHYGSNFFSANGQPTIVASVAAADMGQRVRLTATDMRRVALLYHCDSSGSGRGGSVVGHVAQDVKNLLLMSPANSSSSVTPANSSSLVTQPIAATRGQNRTEEEQMLEASSSSAAPQLSAATRGQNVSSDGADWSHY